MNSKTLNEKIRGLEDRDEFTVKGLETTGKCIPYIGWYWRDVDFGSPIYLGIIPDDVVEIGGSKGGFAGFMENNKWGYEGFECTLPQTQQIEELLIKAVEKTSNETLQAVFDYMQTLRPK